MPKQPAPAAKAVDDLERHSAGSGIRGRRSPSRAAPAARAHRSASVRGEAWDFDAALSWLDSSRSSRLGSRPRPAAPPRRYQVLDGSGRTVAAFAVLDLALAVAQAEIDRERPVQVIDTKHGRPLPLSLLCRRRTADR